MKKKLLAAALVVGVSSLLVPKQTYTNKYASLLQYDFIAAIENRLGALSNYEPYREEIKIIETEYITMRNTYNLADYGEEEITNNTVCYLNGTKLTNYSDANQINLQILANSDELRILYDYDETISMSSNSLTIELDSQQWFLKYSTQDYSLKYIGTNQYCIQIRTTKSQENYSIIYVSDGMTYHYDEQGLFVYNKNLELQENDNAYKEEDIKKMMFVLLENFT